MTTNENKICENQCLDRTVTFSCGSRSPSYSTCSHRGRTQPGERTHARSPGERSSHFPVRSTFGPRRHAVPLWCAIRISANKLPRGPLRLVEHPCLSRKAVATLPERATADHCFRRGQGLGLGSSENHMIQRCSLWCYDPRTANEGSNAGRIIYRRRNGPSSTALVRRLRAAT